MDYANPWLLPTLHYTVDAINFGNLDYFLYQASAVANTEPEMNGSTAFIQKHTILF